MGAIVRGLKGVFLVLIILALEVVAMCLGFKHGYDCGKFDGWVQGVEAQSQWATMGQEGK